MYFIILDPRKGIAARNNIDKQNDLLSLTLIHVNDFHAR